MRARIKNTLGCLLSVPFLYSSDIALPSNINTIKDHAIEVIKTYKESNKRTVSHNRNMYNVTENYGNFIITDENDNEVDLPHNDISDIIFTYYIDKRIDELPASKLAGDVKTLERLVAGSVIKYEILNAIKAVWKNKSNVSGMLYSVFNLISGMEVDPRFYAKILVGNISAHFGPIQMEAVDLYDIKGSFLDSKMAKSIYNRLSESEPLIEPSIDYLRSVMNSPNYVLSDKEREELKKLPLEERKERIMRKIKDSSEFNMFESETNRRADDWEMLKRKAYR